MQSAYSSLQSSNNIVTNADSHDKASGKLLFVSAHQIYAVIASQFANWRGNPPVRGEMYRQAPEKMGIVTILGRNRYLVPFSRGIATTSLRTGLAIITCIHTAINEKLWKDGGIATPVCALVRNDSVFHGNDRKLGGEATNTNLSSSPSRIAALTPPPPGSASDRCGWWYPALLWTPPGWCGPGGHRFACTGTARCRWPGGPPGPDSR